MTLIIHLYRRVMRRGRLIGLIALSSVPALAYWLSAYDSGPGEAEILYSDITARLGFSYAIAVLILTVAVLREERDAGTLPYIYMRPIGRVPMAASSIVAGIGAALTLALAGWMMTLGAIILVGAPLATAGPGLVLYVAAGVGYASVFVPLGYLVPRAVLVGLGYIIVIESILAEVVTGLAQISIWRIALSISAELSANGNPGEMLNAIEPGVGGGVLKLGAVLVIGLGVLTWALRRRDAL